MTFIKSIIIGIFAIFPGISGSALAISLNLYEKIFYSLKNINKNKKFLIIVFLGIILGIIVGSNLIIYLSTFKNVLYYIFVGLIISDIPFMIKKVKNNGRIRYIYLILSFILSVITLLFCKNIFNNNPSFIRMILGGILFSFGKIFPGVSSSFFLIILGIYDKIIICFSNPIIILSNFLYYFPFIIGIVLGLLIFIKLLNYLLANHYDILYSVLIGFMLSSVFSVFPKFEFSLYNLIGVVLMIISFVISVILHGKKDI